ncbi:MAG: glycosyltransferase family 4 protein [Chlamydiota bacterium]
MKILHLESSPGWGGQEIRILKEAEGMRKRGHTVIFGVTPQGLLVKEARNKGFTVYEIDFRKRSWIHSFFSLRQIMRKEEIQIVNTHSSLDSWLGGLVCRYRKIPIVRTRHLSTSVRGGLNSYLLYNQLTDFVITTCESIISEISQKSKKSINFFKSLPTGIDPSVIHPNREEMQKFRNSLGIQETDILVGMACFMRSWKGIDDFFQAAEQLREHKNIKWIMIGGGHEERYRQRAKEKDLPIFFTGHLESPYVAMGSLDIFALLSTAHEGVSQASLQAAFLEKPLIMTPTGGLREVCLDGVTGIQVPVFSPNRVAEAVLRLSKDSSLRKELGKEGKILVKEKFTLQGMLDYTEAIYQSILDPL